MRPTIGPASSAAEITELVAHSVVGHVWLFSAHDSLATYDVDNINAQAITSSAPTQYQLRPKPT